MSNIPIFIPSKSRYDNGLTWKALDNMGISRYRVIVEPQEYDLYRKVLPEKKLIELDIKFKENYKTLDDIPYSENPKVGPGAARNYAWHIARQENSKWHWCIDDNIPRFEVYNNNTKYIAKYDTFAKVEQFCEKYTNVAMAGMQYSMFIPKKQKHAPLIINTRIFSCNLIRNDVPLEWRGRYNEDVILSLDVLKAGYCTILFNTYLCEKLRTQTLTGGNTAEFYADEGTKPKSELLKKVYPQYVNLVMRYGRHHHKVNYKELKKNKLIRKII